MCIYGMVCCSYDCCVAVVVVVAVMLFVVAVAMAVDRAKEGARSLPVPSWP